MNKYVNKIYFANNLTFVQKIFDGQYLSKAISKKAGEVRIVYYTISWMVTAEERTKDLVSSLVLWYYCQYFIAGHIQPLPFFMLSFLGLIEVKVPNELKLAYGFPFKSVYTIFSTTDKRASVSIMCFVKARKLL